MDLRILEIASHTENNKVLENFTHQSKNKNPLCGDEMEISLIVKDNVIICNSGEALFTMERLSKREAPPIGDGTCDCGDCSDEPKT